MKKLVLITGLLLVAVDSWADSNVINLFCHYSEDTNSGETLITIDTAIKTIVLEPVNLNSKTSHEDNWKENQLMFRAENERAIITINRQTLTMQSKLKGKYAKAKLKEEKKRKNGSRSFTKFSEMMDERPTSLGDLGKLIEEENSKDSEVNQKVDVTITSYECDLVEQKI